MPEVETIPEKTFKAGEVLFREGEPGNEMYLIRSGRIEISAFAAGTKKTLAVLKEGDFIGEMAIIDEKPRSATALEDTTCLTLDREAFKSQLKENPMIEYLVSMLIKRLRETNKQIEILLQKDDLCRLVASLLTMAKDKGVKRPDGVVIDAEVTNRDLSHTVGTTEPMVETMMKDLIGMGLISVNEHLVTVRSFPELEEYWQFITLKEKFKKRD
jgi:CRP/FNR family transcriptional regulator, cyclic AMP receptor protein